MFKKVALISSLCIAAAIPREARAGNGNGNGNENGNVGQACTNATSMTGSAFYVSCAGFFTGNINSSSNAADNAMLAGIFGGTWTFNSSQTFNGANAGTVNVSALSGFFILGVKTSNEYSLYLYNKTSATPTSIPWATIGTTSNGNNGGAAISHLNIYTGVGGPNGQCIRAANSESCLPTTSVPEPSTYALMTAGLLGIFGVARRRRNSAKV